MVFHAIDGVEMVVVAVRSVLLRVDVLPERGVEIGTFEVMRCKSVAGKDGVYISRLDNFGERDTGVAIEGKRRGP